LDWTDSVGAGMVEMGEDTGRQRIAEVIIAMENGNKPRDVHAQMH